MFRASFSLRWWIYCTARLSIAPLAFSPEPFGTMRPSSFIPSLMLPLRRRSTSFWKRGQLRNSGEDDRTRTWLSFRCRAHSSFDIVALRPVRRPAVFGLSESFGDDGPAPGDCGPSCPSEPCDICSFGEAPVLILPRFGGPRGWDDGPGSMPGIW